MKLLCTALARSGRISGRRRPWRASWLLFSFSLLALASAAQASSHHVTFAVVGDVHLALNSENEGMKMLSESERVLGLVIDSLNETAGLDFVVFNGDLVDLPTDANVRRFKEMAGHLRVPYYVTLGNHDVPHAGPSDDSHLHELTREEVVQIFRGNGFEQGGRSWWSATPKAGFHIVGLDSAVPGKWGGHVDADALGWLQSDLQEYRDHLTVIFVHHGLVSFWEGVALDEGFFVDNRDEVRELCERYPAVQCIVSSHLHVGAGLIHRGIRYFTTPSVISYPCGFALFTVSPEAIEMTRVPIADSGVVNAARLLLPSDVLWRGFFPSGARGEGEMREFFEGGEFVRFPLVGW